MSKCTRCNIEILDKTMMCPLCHGVVENENEESFENHSLMYPDVMPAIKRLKFVFKLFVFISILLEILLIIINYITFNGVSWSAICGVGLAYAGFTVYFACQRHSEHRAKILISFFLAMAMFVIIDKILGYSGWSVNYVIPVMVMVIDVVILILMLANSRYWQSYIMPQLIMVVFCIVGMILVLKDVIKHPLLMIIATGVTGIILVGTLIFGDKAASTELSRRFKM